MLSSIGYIGFSVSLTLVAAVVLAVPQTLPTPSCSLSGVSVPDFNVRSIDAVQFQALHQAVVPGGAGERWMEIPWQSDLVAARREAARERKPLLMWVMDGHPLGCT